MEQVKSNSGGGLFAFLFLLPLILISIGFAIFGWLLARMGGRYRLVKFVTFPAAFIVSNVVMMVFTISGAFLLTLITGKPAIVSYIFENWTDLTVFAVWGPAVSIFWNFNVIDFSPHIPWWHIILFQLGTFWVFGHRWSRLFALGIFDLVIAQHADTIGEDMRRHRATVLANDAGYMQDSVHYDIRRSVGFLGVIVLGFSGRNPADFY